MRRTSRGLTLLEVLVALIVFTMSAGMALQALRGASDLSVASGARMQALALAENALLDAQQVKAAPQVRNGQFRVSVQRLPYQGRLLESASVRRAALEEVVVTVRWRERLIEKSLELRDLQFRQQGR